MADVEGMQELLAKMDNMTYVLQKRAIARSLRAGGELLAEDLSKAAPRSDEAPHMADTMMVTVGEQTATGAIAKVGPSRKGYYAKFTEFGTMFISAQGWFRRIWDSRQTAVTKKIGDVLAEEIEAAAK